MWALRCCRVVPSPPLLCVRAVGRANSCMQQSAATTLCSRFVRHVLITAVVLGIYTNKQSFNVCAHATSSPPCTQYGVCRGCVGSARLPAWLPAWLPACRPACLPACLPASLPACLAAGLPTCLAAGLPAYLPGCRPGCLPCLPCLSVRLSVLRVPCALLHAWLTHDDDRPPARALGATFHLPPLPDTCTTRTARRRPTGERCSGWGENSPCAAPRPTRL